MRTSLPLPLLLLLGAMPLAAGMLARISSAQEAQDSVQDPVPYTATVIVDDAALRCGPSDKYYPVSYLQRGDKVEVYKNIRGWCAIRPPEGCFSWVPARQMRVDAAGKVGVITDPKAVAWIGSNVEHPTTHFWQVQLEVGEAVAIIGERRFTRKSEDTSETYYKIAPPAGEFRWIQARYLSKSQDPSALAPAPQQIASRQLEAPPLTGDDLVAADAAPANHTESIPEPAPLPASTARSAAPITAQTSTAPLSQPKRKTGFRDVTPGRESTGSLFDSPAPTTSASNSTTIPSDPNQRVAFVAPFENDPATARDSASNAPSFTAPSASPSAGTSGASGVEEFYTKLAQVETQLGLAVSKPPHEWNLTTLRLQAQHLTENGPSPLERGRARLLLDRIDLYETHQRQTLELERSRLVRSTTPPPPSGSPSTAPAPASPADIPSTPAPWKPAEQEPLVAESEGAAGQPEEKSSKENWLNKVKEVVGNGVKGTTSPAKPTHFDAQGKLQRVISDNADVKFPPFALQDDEGRIIAFVGSPVVKLEKYLGKRVGVYGPRGTHTASQTTYIDVVELVELDVANKPMRGTFGMIK